MSEEKETKPTTPANPPVKPANPAPAQVEDKPVAPTKEQVEAHVSKIKNFLKQFEGKTGYNPFIYFKKAIAPLRDRALKGDSSAAAALLKVDPETKPSQKLLMEDHGYPYGADVSDEAKEREAMEENKRKAAIVNKGIPNIEDM